MRKLKATQLIQIFGFADQELQLLGAGAARLETRDFSETPMFVEPSELEPY